MAFRTIPTSRLEDSLKKTSGSSDALYAKCSFKDFVLHNKKTAKISVSRINFSIIPSGVTNVLMRLMMTGMDAANYTKLVSTDPSGKTNDVTMSSISQNVKFSTCTIKDVTSFRQVLKTVRDTCKLARYVAMHNAAVFTNFKSTKETTTVVSLCQTIKASASEAYPFALSETAAELLTTPGIGTGEWVNQEAGPIVNTLNGIIDDLNIENAEQLLFIPQILFWFGFLNDPRNLSIFLDPLSSVDPSGVKLRAASLHKLEILASLLLDFYKVVEVNATVELLRFFCTFIVKGDTGLYMDEIDKMMSTYIAPYDALGAIKVASLLRHPCEEVSKYQINWITEDVIDDLPIMTKILNALTTGDTITPLADLQLEPYFKNVVVKSGDSLVRYSDHFSRIIAGYQTSSIQQEDLASKYYALEEEVLNVIRNKATVIGSRLRRIMDGVSKDELSVRTLDNYMSKINISAIRSTDTAKRTFDGFKITGYAHNVLPYNGMIPSFEDNVLKIVIGEDASIFDFYTNDRVTNGVTYDKRMAASLAEVFKIKTCLVPVNIGGIEKTVASSLTRESLEAYIIEITGMSNMKKIVDALTYPASAATIATKLSSFCIITTKDKIAGTKKQIGDAGSMSALLELSALLDGTDAVKSTTGDFVEVSAGKDKNRKEFLVPGHYRPYGLTYDTLFKYCTESEPTLTYLDGALNFYMVKYIPIPSDKSLAIRFLGYFPTIHYLADLSEVESVRKTQLIEVAGYGYSNAPIHFCLLNLDNHYKFPAEFFDRFGTYQNKFMMVHKNGIGDMTKFCPDIELFVQTTTSTKDIGQFVLPLTDLTVLKSPVRKQDIGLASPDDKVQDDLRKEMDKRLLVQQAAINEEATKALNIPVTIGKVEALTDEVVGDKTSTIGTLPKI